ncbi:hypothetical protein HK105_206811 [Polyrhizophydium stewartii]|uniref:Swiss Army Knife RNA repair protein HAD domain-containing protein n=1 Tax=Polyrhizophydium stewartii TaxID=2732419 RepID=A0ABR4N2E2_9FUNG
MGQFQYELAIEDFSRICLTADDLRRSLSRKTAGPYSSSHDLHVLVSPSAPAAPSPQPPQSPEPEPEAATPAAAAAAAAASAAAAHPPPHRRRHHQRHVVRLVIFDFDSTLFRSPLPNADLWAGPLRGRITSDCGWFTDPRTLEAPYVPDVPGDAWWHAETVDRVFEALAREDTLTVLLTGRRHDLFSKRIEDMCRRKSPRPLSFDLFFFREGHDPQAGRHHPTTLDFKLAVLDRLLETFTTLKHVEFYDDRERHLKLFQQQIESLVTAQRLQTYAMHHVVHEKTLEQHIPPALERALVMDMIESCNRRIHQARAREKQVADAANAAAASANAAAAADTAADAGIPRSSSPVNMDPAQDGAAADGGSAAAGSSSSSDCQRRSPSPQDSGVHRRVSISIFRNLIEAVETVRSTVVRLDDASRAALLERFPVPARWQPKADHVTVSLGAAPDDVVAAMGGLGARVSFWAVDVGEIEGSVRAVRVLGEAAPGARALVTCKPTAYVTLCVAPRGIARQALDISAWQPIGEPVPLTGTLEHVMIMDLKPAPPRAAVTPKDVSIGALVKKHHPELRGRMIGAACAVIEQWMSKTFIENLEANRANIEFFILSPDFAALLEEQRARLPASAAGSRMGSTSEALAQPQQPQTSSQ